jgi:hypothetical protein
MIRQVRRTVTFFAFLLLLPGGVVQARTEASPGVPRFDEPVIIDGSLAEPAWQGALRISVPYLNQPYEGGTAPVETTMFIFEDGENLYVAFEAMEPNPETIRAYLRDRDDLFDDDYAGIMIDPFNDGRRAYGFAVNPLGIQLDVVRDEITREYDFSWDAIWDSAGQLTGDGFTVEMRIPLSQLRFPATEGRQTWRIMGYRGWPRDEEYEFGTVSLDLDNTCEVCQYSTIEGFEGARPGRDLEIVPTLTLVRADVLPSPSAQDLVRGHIDAEQGISLRWGVTPDITASFTINPDFSQVEADVPELDINQQFAIYYPEKRPFFLEGADYYQTPMQAVFTRTVADPRYGIKLTGRRGEHTFGAFLTQDSTTNLLLPGPFQSTSTFLDTESDVFVGRYSRNIGASNIGGLLTIREAEGYRNSVGGFDGRWNVTDQDSVRVQVLRSQTEYPSSLANEWLLPEGSFSGNALQLTYSHDARDWFWSVNRRDIDDQFRADAGFMTKVGYDWSALSIGRNWYGSQDTFWSRMQLRGHWDASHTADGRLMERESKITFQLSGTRDSSIEAQIYDKSARWRDSYYPVFAYSLMGSITPVRGLELKIFTWGGEEIDYENDRLADRFGINPALQWSVNTNMLLNFGFTRSLLDTKQGAPIFDARLLDARATWQFNTRSFIRLTVQEQDIERNSDVYAAAVFRNARSRGLQLLYSYKLNPQTVFFVGYSDNHIDNDLLTSSLMTDRTFFMKIGYAWVPDMAR